MLRASAGDHSVGPVNLPGHPDPCFDTSSIKLSRRDEKNFLIRPAARVINRGLRTHQHTTGNKTAIGCVRVSTQDQATDGVGLDAQSDKLRADCKLSAIKLIDIKADEGMSGSTLERPGLQAALSCSGALGQTRSSS